ncbi:MAG: DUF429 domain-containing protein [Chloroflexota bacterium]
MKYIGVDGCHYGWFAVILEEDSNQPDVDVFKNISELWNKYKDAKLILIDIPIGLRDSGAEERLCDKAARKFLGQKRGCSVFRVPCRSAVYASKDKANEINCNKTGKCISEQTKNISSKIKQVDELLCKHPEARLNVREIHPEICFWALNGKNPMEYNKKKKAGFCERKQTLCYVYPHTDELTNKAENEFCRKDVAKDDILDALVAAIIASQGKNKLKSLPKTPEIDRKGLPMQMLYYPA